MLADPYEFERQQLEKIPLWERYMPTDVEKENDLYYDISKGK